MRNIPEFRLLVIPRKAKLFILNFEKHKNFSISYRMTKWIIIQEFWQKRLKIIEKLCVLGLLFVFIYLNSIDLCLSGGYSFKIKIRLLK